MWKTESAELHLHLLHLQMIIYDKAFMLRFNRIHEEPEGAFHIKVLTREVPLSTRPVMVLDREAESSLESSLGSAFTACTAEGRNYLRCITGGVLEDGEGFCETDAQFSESSGRFLSPTCRRTEIIWAASSVCRLSAFIFISHHHANVHEPPRSW